MADPAPRPTPPVQRLLAWIADRFLRIDARSLGLFRILFGVTLIADLKVRWNWIEAFYSNEGVLPNHNHLFQLRDTGGVWSVYHAFSSADETRVAFAFTLLFYLLFALGWYTRAFAVVSAVCLVSLSGRNVLIDGIGDSLAICLLLFAMFLPLGARYSIDSLRASFAAVDEHRPADLNDRGRPVARRARPSLAALGILLLLGGVPLAAALQQKGATWQSGDALYYALRTDRWLSWLGEAARAKLSPGALAGYTRVLKACEYLVLPLALVPVARKYVRPLAMVVLGFLGLTFALLFSLGPYGWSMLAGVALLAPAELWDAPKPKNRPIRLYYDEDCGICLWLARLLKRIDARQNVTFIGNNSVTEQLSENYRDPPEGVNAETADKSMIAIDPAGKAHTDAEALAQVLWSLPPLGWLVAAVISVPGIKDLVAWLYYKVADNRLKISEACGLGACGLPRAADKAGKTEDKPEPTAAKWRHGVAIALETVLVAGVLAVVVAETEAANELPLHTGLANRPRLLRAASYARVLAEWDLWSPDPPLRNEALVTTAQLREGVEIDVLNGYPPDVDLAQPARHRLGALWATYEGNVRRDEYAGFKQEFRRYLQRGAVVADAMPETPPVINRLDVFWVSAPIAKPGQAPAGEIDKRDLFDVGFPTRPFVPDFGDSTRTPHQRNQLRQLR